MKTRTLLAALRAASLNLTIANAQEKGADPYVAPEKHGPPAAAGPGTEDKSLDQPNNVSICSASTSLFLTIQFIIKI